jgi:hypothetical protein
MTKNFRSHVLAVSQFEFRSNALQSSFYRLDIDFESVSSASTLNLCGALVKRDRCLPSLSHALFFENISPLVAPFQSTEIVSPTVTWSVVSKLASG